MMYKGKPHHTMLKNGVKRLFDISLCLLFIPFVLLIVAICGILIKLDSHGPVFFRQERLGQERKPFCIVKLRTMVANAEKMGAGLYTVQNDPRFTKIGLFLRRLSLDELPQFFNVVAGDMSIVGPRPLPATVIAEYPEQFDVILKVKPGITGLSQVNGRNTLSRSERLKMDMFYAQNWSFDLDVHILLRTISTVLTGAGQVNYQGREDVEQ